MAEREREGGRESRGGWGLISCWSPKVLYAAATAAAPRCVTEASVAARCLHISRIGHSVERALQLQRGLRAVRSRCHQIASCCAATLAARSTVGAASSSSSSRGSATLGE